MPDERRTSGRPPVGPRHDSSYGRSTSPQRERRGRDRDWERSRSRERTRERQQSRSPPRRIYSESYRPHYSEPSTKKDPRGSESGQSSMTGSPIRNNPPPQPSNDGSWRPSVTRHNEPRLETQDEVMTDHAILEPPVETTTAKTDQSSLTAKNFTNMLAGKLATLVRVMVQEDAARETKNKRNAEFLKAAPQHEMFPNTKLYQTEAKNEAERYHASLCNTIEKQNSELVELSAQTIEALASYVVGLATSDKDKSHVQQLQDRFDSLEKAQTSLIQERDSQTVAIEDLKKQLSDCHTRLEGQSSSIREMGLQLTKSKIEHDSKLNEMSTYVGSLKNVLEQSSKDIETLKPTNVELLKVKERLVSLELKPPSLSFSADPLATALSNRVSSMQQMLEVASNKLDGLEQETLSVSQRESQIHTLSERLRGTEVRLKSVEINQKDATSTALKQTDEMKSLATLTSASRNSLELSMGQLGNRLAHIENAQGAGFSKVQQLEKLMNSLPPTPTSPAVTSSLKTQEARILRLEKLNSTQTPRPSPQPATPQPEFVQHLENLGARVASFEAIVGQIKAGQDSLAVSISDTVTQITNSVVDEEVEPRIKELESGLQKMNESAAANAKNVESTFREISIDTENRVVGFLRSNPSIVPQSRSDAEILRLSNIVEVITNEQRGLTNGFTNLDARINNIHTGHLATYMLDQLGSRFAFDEVQADVRSMIARQERTENELSRLQNTFKQNTHTTATGVAKIGESVDALRVANDVTATRFTDLGATIVSLAEQVEHLKSAQSQQNSRVSFLTDSDVRRFESLEMQLATLSQQYTQQTSNFNDVHMQLRTQIEAWETFQPQLTKDVALIQSEVKALQASERVSLVETEISSIKTQLDAEKWTANIASWDTRTTKLEEHIRELRQSQKETADVFSARLKEINEQRKPPPTEHLTRPSAPSQQNGSGVASKTVPTSIPAAQSDRQSKLGNTHHDREPPTRNPQAATSPPAQRQSSPLESTAARRPAVTDAIKAPDLHPPRRGMNPRGENKKSRESPIRSDILTSSSSSKKRKHGKRETTPPIIKSTRSSNNGPAQKRTRIIHGFISDDPDEDRELIESRWSGNDTDDDGFEFLSENTTGRPVFRSRPRSKQNGERKKV